MYYSPHTVSASGVIKDEFKKKSWMTLLVCLGCSIICCTPGWSRTAIGEVSGTGAQASARDSYTQTGRSLTRDLTGTLQGTKVSGAISMNSSSAPARSTARSYGGLTNVTQVDPNHGPSKATSDAAVFSLASACGWTGYWTWSYATWSWYWTWVYTCSGGGITG
jgi:hypothetical protein